MGPGPFGQDTEAVLTPTDAQTLPGLLPQGWSPLSAFWLARFRYGPFEWLWRTITYARVQPLRRSLQSTSDAAILGRA